MLEKPVSRYRAFLMIELMVVVAVIGIFKIVNDRATAGWIAGSVFFFSTLFILITEWKTMRRGTAALIGGLIFFFGGVIPILGLRAMSQDVGVFHRVSNLLFMIFLVGIFISLQRARLKPGPMNSN